MKSYREAAIKEFAEAFEEADRRDGTKYFRLRDPSPAWMREAVWRAHDGASPCDWRYKTCYLIVDAMRQYDADTMGKGELLEIAESLVDPHEDTRVRWMAAHDTHVHAVDKAMELGYVGAGDTISERIRVGQELMIETMAARLWYAIRERADELAAKE